MKRLIFALLLLSTPAYAETVRVYTDYLPVRILRLVDGTNMDLEANKAGLSGNFKEMDSSSLPQNRQSRNFWKLDKGAIIVDEEKKAAEESKKLKLESDKVSAIGKLKATGLTDDELKALNIGG